MNKYGLPVYKELVLALREQRKQLQDIVEDMDKDIDFYEGIIAEYLERKKVHP